MNAQHSPVPVAWDLSVMVGVAGVLAATELGLTGSEIGTTLRLLGLDDLSSLATKRNRLSNALIEDQEKTHIAVGAMAFISAVMRRDLYVDEPEQFAVRQRLLNEILGSCLLRIDDDGVIRDLTSGREAIPQ